MVQVMAWRRAGDYLNQIWPSAMTPYTITSPNCGEPHTAISASEPFIGLNFSHITSFIHVIVHSFKFMLQLQLPTPHVIVTALATKKVSKLDEY